MPTLVKQRVAETHRGPGEGHGGAVGHQPNCQLLQGSLHVKGAHPPALDMPESEQRFAQEAQEARLLPKKFLCRQVMFL